MSPERLDRLLKGVLGLMVFVCVATLFYYALGAPMWGATGFGLIASQRVQDEWDNYDQRSRP